MRRRLRPRRKKGSTQSPGWYVVHDVNGDYYTPYKKRKRKVDFIGNGKDQPLPGEIAEFLEDNPESEYYPGGFFESHLDTDSDSELCEIPAGYYRHCESSGKHPERIVPYSLRTDGRVEIDEMESLIEKDISEFLASESIYRKIKIVYKLGLLFYGPPGDGKTTLIRQILQNLIEKHDAIVICVSDQFMSADFIEKAKKYLGHRLKVFVFEELAANLSQWYIGMLLEFLDGELTIDKSIVLGTTNYPEKLPGNIADRPSRFDKLYPFGHPKDAARKKLIEFFLGEPISDQIVALSKGLSRAAIKEICLRSLIAKVPLETSIKALKARTELVKKAFAEEKAIIGFSYDDE